MTAYYNEIDPFAAQWLRNLIAAGHIAPGDVDERSIEDVRPDDLKGYTQCHFFAGVGVWSLALRRAGWDDSRPIWTGSCPCQPFSASGKKSGFVDERHLWPAFYWLIRECRPGVVAGEQVASKAAEPWIDLVQADLEAMGYAFGCVPFPSAGIGAPHIRDRAYWVGHTNNERLEGYGRRHPAPGRQREAAVRPVTEAGESGRLANGDSSRRTPGSEGRQTLGHRKAFESDCRALGLANGNSLGRVERCTILEGGRGGSQAERLGQQHGSSGVLDDCGPAGPTNGFWSDADWLHCRDGKWRPVEPGTFPLVDGPTRGMGRVQPGLAKFYGRNRTGRLKGYGNAINADAASAFAAAVRSILDEQHRTA